MSGTHRDHLDVGAQPATVAVLYPGELGAELAALLVKRGMRVVTTLDGRSETTARRCCECGITVLETLEDVVRQSDMVFSLVPPSAAEEMTADYCDLAHLAPKGAIYVDANSIGPDLAKGLAGKIEARGIAFVDAAVNGLAKNLTKSGTLYLSGARANEIAALFGDGMRIRTLGNEPGRASAMKMLLAGLSKGICALYVELALLAHRQGMSAELAEETSRIYPGIFALVERMLPTYAQHAGRRATEMHELELTAGTAGIEPCVIAAVRGLHQVLAAASFDATPQGGWTAQSLIEKLAEEQILAVDLSAAQGKCSSFSGGQ
jgi:3-hydroxyisobutyrate dehydrogenase-like beta-hydroxyacid dehydrogenase